MILSMTGYGRVKKNHNDHNITVEIKSLNGKSSDVRCKLPSFLKEKELIIRKTVLDHAVRGKMEVNIEVQLPSGSEAAEINKTLFAKYYSELSELANDLGENQTNLFASILRLPQVLESAEQNLTDDVWKEIQNCIQEALEKLKDFRSSEGEVMYSDFTEKVTSIQSWLDEIPKYEEERLENLRTRLNKQLNEMAKELVDQNRFEQEVIYYIEKLDINEEKVRLAQHCKYFIEVLNSNASEVGKKLSFIAQEMGREINTIGSKAQNKNLQRIVVNMKDDLEKIKEQLANIV